jgi:SAM-dependent methyltransferase
MSLSRFVDHISKMAHLTKRKLAREHMDDPHATRAELDVALRYLRLVNRRLGGTAAALRQFKQWSASWNRRSVVRILDVGTGSADIPLAIADWAKRCSMTVNIVGVDMHPTTVEIARENVRGRDEIEVVQADALKLMDRFEPASFDYAHAGLFLHHLPDIDVMTVLRIMDRLATKGIIWNDLVRLPLPRLWMWPFTLGASAMVKHDAIASVEAGFKETEAIELATRAGLSGVRYRRHLWHRFTLVSDKARLGVANSG